MSERGKRISTRIVETVAQALGEDPIDLPPLERTISARALDLLFHEGHQPPGAYTVFPYCGLWVLVNSDGTVDVFDEFRATSSEDELPDDVSEPTSDERVVILDDGEERHAFVGDELDDVHDIIDEADDSEAAWEETLDYARDH